MSSETLQNDYTRVFLQTAVGSSCRNVLCQKAVGVDEK